MNVFHNLFNRVIGLNNLISSWREFRIGKKNKEDVLLFERNLEDNIWGLRDELASKTYKHGGYSSFFVQDPKVRHIHKASVRDRVVHHATVRHLTPIFEPMFISDSYSCRVGKGSYAGINRFIAYARKVSKNHTQPCWVLKCDVRKFFASVDQKVLLDILFRQLRTKNMQWLLREIISSFRSDRTVNPNELKGIPIGNLTSQLFANVYLNELDQFVKHHLKERHYIRYADDFVILHTQRDHCFEVVEKINVFLRDTLKLELHPNKIFVRKFSQGVDFLGYVCFPDFIIPRHKTKDRIFKRIHEKIQLYKSGKTSEDSLEHTIQSYFGVLCHSNSFEVQQDLENQIFFWLTNKA